jgi:hypothetical protein
MRDVAREIDEELKPFLAPLKLAIQHSRLVVALQLWRRTKSLSLIPFQLHLRWPDEVAQLPLFAAVSLAPFFVADEEQAELSPLYSVHDAHEARTRARIARHKEKRNLPDDFRFADWEDGAKRRPELRDLVLPGASFVGVDRVSPPGDVRKVSRSRLGRYCGRRDRRPCLLVPGKRGITTGAAREALTQTELLIANLQGIRGRKTLDALHDLIAARDENRATLIVASNPTELLTLGLTGIERADHVVIGKPLSLLEARVFAVGKDRMLAERSYEFAVSNLGVQTDETLRTLNLAKSAWWAIRQSVGIESEDLPEVHRFLNALDNLKVIAPHEAVALSGIEHLLGSVTGNTLASERRQAVVEAVLDAEGFSEILVLARDARSARLLRQALAETLDEPIEVLAELGVNIRPHSSPPPITPPETVVLAGYFGRASLDAALASGANKIRCVMDPAEVRVAGYGLRQTLDYLEAIGAHSAAAGLEALLEELDQHSPPEAADLKVDLDLKSSNGNAAWSVQRERQVASNEALVHMTDGFTLSVKLNAKLDVLPEKGSRFCSTSVVEVQPGDRIVILYEDERSSFSQELMAVLDEGQLRQEAQKRRTWITIVNSMVSQKRPNLREIYRQMKARGEPVSYDAVRAWARPSVETSGSVPSTYGRFMAFAELLGVNLPEAELAEFFQNIRRWRINHRKAGRKLARVIRAAYLDRLDAVTLAKVEREWGFEIRRLLEAAHVGIVDEVVLPEDRHDDAD